MPLCENRDGCAVANGWFSPFHASWRWRSWHGHSERTGISATPFAGVKHWHGRVFQVEGKSPANLIARHEETESPPEGPKVQTKRAEPILLVALAGTCVASRSVFIDANEARLDMLFASRTGRKSATNTGEPTFDPGVSRALTARRRSGAVTHGTTLHADRPCVYATMNCVHKISTGLLKGDRRAYSNG